MAHFIETVASAIKAFFLLVIAIFLLAAFTYPEETGMRIKAHLKKAGWKISEFNIAGLKLVLDEQENALKQSNAALSSAKIEIDTLKKQVSQLNSTLLQSPSPITPNGAIDRRRPSFIPLPSPSAQDELLQSRETQKLQNQLDEALRGNNQALELNKKLILQLPPQ
ncbi:hypothetical protein SAMN05444141_102247 [Pseudovibrio denitrificans]|uniref:Uncharacterized protein n=1 Tax=Pseudovibrio denitrificans TaxID=258256 RepID=A0A1I6ZCL4_9HYPH|nr:hypothetical protein [Pseudovibrio denitrificans]SFT60437.1 hypothetical protein SAMN05444141_102247 [Pseudovibrio denitrificans]